MTLDRDVSAWPRATLIFDQRAYRGVAILSTCCTTAQPLAAEAGQGLNRYLAREWAWIRFLKFHSESARDCIVVHVLVSQDYV
jgi:hypothetical protein